MALVIEDEYTNAAEAGTDYPQGSFVNESSAGALDGTPLDQAWPNDIYGFLQALLAAGGITPSGSPDTAVASDYYLALEAIFAKAAALTTHAALTSPHGAVSAAIASKLIVRDSAGRAKVVAPAVSSDIALLSNVEAITPTTGTFNLTTSGFATEQTVTCTYQLIGKMLTVYIPGITGTSDLYDFDLTGLPSAYYPVDFLGEVGTTLDATVTALSRITISNSTGKIQIYSGLVQNGWNTSSTKKFYAKSFSWKIA